MAGIIHSPKLQRDSIESRQVVNCERCENVLLFYRQIFKAIKFILMRRTSPTPKGLAGRYHLMCNEYNTWIYRLTVYTCTEIVFYTLSDLPCTRLLHMERLVDVDVLLVCKAGDKKGEPVGISLSSK